MQDRPSCEPNRRTATQEILNFYVPRSFIISIAREY